MQLPRSFIFATLFFSLHHVHAQNTVNVPISDPSIVRTGNGWKDNLPIPGSGVSTTCGSWTQEAGDFVTFTFTGTSVSVNGDINDPDATQATLDGNVLSPLSALGNGIVCNEILFRMDNLEPTEHTLVVKAVDHGGSSLMTIQSISYVAAVVTSSSSSSSTTSSSTTAQTSTSASSSLTSSSSSPVTSSASAPGEVSTQLSANVRTTHKAGKIAGGVIGALAGLLLLLLALFQGHNLAYLLSSLGFFLFGWWLFRGRLFVFFGDRKLGPTEITIFLSNHEIISDTPKERDQILLAWQVIKIGHSRRTFSVSCPCLKGTGETRLGFGDVEDSGAIIRSQSAAPAPTSWDGTVWEELKSDASDASSLGIAFKNNQETSADVALGTHEELKNREVFLPFLRISNVPAGGIHTADGDLYLHAFVTHGYEAGKYDDELVGAIREDMLTERGIKVADLKPRSHWYITQKANGKLKLQVKGLLKSKAGKERGEKAV